MGDYVRLGDNQMFEVSQVGCRPDAVFQSRGGSAAVTGLHGGAGLAPCAVADGGRSRCLPPARRDPHSDHRGQLCIDAATPLRHEQDFARKP
jgi:hypothetical protein